MKTEKLEYLPYEPEIGKVYMIGGVKGDIKVRCEERKGCTGCYGDRREYKRDTVPCRIKVSCTEHSRKDKKSVILKLVK